MKHTPGPWVYRFRVGGTWVETLDETVLAQVHPTYGVGDVDANARLIAAAPEMLAQLKGWLAIFSRPGIYLSPLTQTAIKETEALIAKAEGGA